jgi:hypothetical protein
MTPKMSAVMVPVHPAGQTAFHAAASSVVASNASIIRCSVLWMVTKAAALVDGGSALFASN